MASLSGRGQPVRFEAIDVFIDSRRQPLAAYQVEFSGRKDAVRIVGVEGGEHEAYKEPPYYDPKAMRHERVIIAAYNPGNKTPTGKTRVATIHVQVLGDPHYRVKLRAAANSEGTPISVQIGFSERKSE